MVRRATWLATVAATSLAACFSPSLTPGLPCAHDHDPPCPDGQVCDEAADTCVPNSALGTWRDDTATDFTDPSVGLDNAIIEPAGTVGPVPYYVDGTAIAGIDAPAIGAGNQGTVSWDSLTAQSIAGRGFLHGDLDLTVSGAVAGAGLPDTSNSTLLFTGEVFLDAGDTALQLDCDDRGFFDLYTPETSSFTRVLAATNGGPPNRTTVSVPADGWYSFHGAVETDNGGTRFTLSADLGDGFEDFPPDRLRVRVDGLDGFALDGFFDAYDHDYVGTSLSTAALDQRQDWGTTGYPPDLTNLGNAEWSARYQGQILITVAGDYAFRLDTEGGHRMWLDGVQVADVDDADASELTVTPAMTLDVGWHDLAIDTMKFSDNQSPTHFQLTVDSGPDLVGGFVPVDRMRPVVGRGARWMSRQSASVVAIPDGASASKNMFVTMPPGVTTAMEVDYAYTVTHPLQAQLGATLERPGSTTPLFAAGDLTGVGEYSARLRFYDAPANGDWRITATDSTVDTMVGSITLAQLSMTYKGGRAPFEPVARYTSRVRELGPVVAFSGVRWQGRQVAPDGIKVALRSCDTADACAAEPWTPVAASGDVAGIPARPFAQYQVEIDNDTDIPSALDWIEIDYRLP